jgi:ubiquitin-protein ligase
VDQILDRFCRANWRNAHALAGESEMLELVPFGGGDAPRAVAAHFNAYCWVKDQDGVHRQLGFTIGFRFPEHYLTPLVQASEVIHFVGPNQVFHPNIRPGACCLGNGFQPGLELRDLLFRTYSLVTGQQRSQPADPLNPAAAAYYRRHWPMEPADNRPLKWRSNGEKV